MCKNCAMKHTVSFSSFFFDESQYGFEVLLKDTKWLHTYFPVANG